MAQDNTKLCDFTNTNNNDFLSTPIAPLTDTESCEINAALLNLVMKDQFAGLPSEDAATHLNSFVDLCDMQKKKDVDNDIVKLKLFPFSLRDRAKAWFSSLPKNSIDSWNKCKDAFISKYFPPPTSPLPFYSPSLFCSPLFRLLLVCSCVGLLACHDGSR